MFGRLLCHRCAGAVPGHAADSRARRLTIVRQFFRSARTHKIVLVIVQNSTLDHQRRCSGIAAVDRTVQLGRRPPRVPLDPASRMILR
nr:hypothetical protein GCM10010200_082570 [Actinomadura rugatobispora]